jgi:hypothetical protein
MKKLLVLLTYLTLVFWTSNSTAAVISGGIINPANGNIYYLLSEANWTNSEAEAISLGGNLVTINNAEENDWVYDTFSFFGGVQRDIWLGLNDVSSEGNFVWSSGEQVTYTNFGNGEPNDGSPLPQPATEDYVHMLAQPFLPINAREWNDAQDVVAGIYGVVEIVTPVPVPSAIILFMSGLISLTGFKRWMIK